jgi:DNA polymerase I-like protein with 3'-5' exonuclease and polymerase domains
MWIDLMAESRTLRNIAIAKRYMKPFQQAHPEIYRPNQDITLLESVDIFGVEGGGDADFKEVSRELVMSRQWESGDEGIWQQICAYCESDVRLTARLLMKVEPHIGNLQEALIRGRYAAEQGRMTARGIPVDRHMLQRLKVEHLQILQRYREEVDPDGIRLTPKGRISQSWLARKLTALGIKPQHPHTRTGKASTKAADLTETAGEFGDEELRRIAQWAQLVKIFSEGKDGELKFSAMGADGRVRYSQLPFLTNTGRSGAFEETALMSLPKWMRGLVQPLPGEVLLCADFSAEEFAVAAGLSRDVQMQQAYAAGDPYVNMALAAGLEEDQARQARSMYKSLVLGKMFGMGLQRFRERSGVSYAQAVQAWRFFDREFARFREWQKRTAMLARQRGWIKTRYGWMARVYPATRDTSLMNWIIQSSAGDVLRLTVLLLAEAGIDVLMTMHDAVLVSCPESQAAEVSAAVVRIMREAAEIAVGLAIRVELQEVRPGERLLSKDTLPEWQRVMDLLESVA